MLPHRRLFHFVLLLCFVGSRLAVSAQDDDASRRAAIEGIYPIMIAALEAKNFGRARNICDQAIIWEPQNPVHHYNLACIEAQAGGSRLAYAFGALELAIALGFNDADHLRLDPDLAPIRGDPRFNELLRKTTNNASADLAIAAITIPPPSKKKNEETPATPAEAGRNEPEPASFRDGLPVGLFFMTRYWTSTRTLEQAAWYFTRDGAVYRNLKQGFAASQLATLTDESGRAQLRDNKLEIVWHDGKTSTGQIEREGNGFIWDRGIFTAVHGYENASDVAGIYQCGETLEPGGNATRVSKRLELRPDGTFVWDGVAFVGGKSPMAQLSDAATTGRWQLSGYSLNLTDTHGTVLRQIVFPYDGEKTALTPSQMFFGGLMYKKQ